MRTRTRTDSTAGQRLDFSWDSDDSNESVPVIPPDNGKSEEDTHVPETPQDTPVVNETPEPSATANDPSDETTAAAPVETPIYEPPKEENEPPEAISSETQEPPAEAEAKQPEPQPQQDVNQHIATKKQKFKLPRGTQNTSIVNNGTSLGTRLKEFRENANVSIDDLSKRLHIQSSIIQDLENGDYVSLSNSFKDNNAIYLVASIKDICGELGVSKNQTDELVDLYYDEIANSGLPLNDAKSPQIPDMTENADNDARIPVGDKEPIIKKLPKIMVFLLLICIVLFIFISIVMPYIKVVRKPPQRKLDFAPLIAPEKVPPIRLTVP